MRCAFGAGSWSAPNRATVTWGGTNGTTPTGMTADPDGPAWLYPRPEWSAPERRPGWLLFSPVPKGLAVRAVVQNWLPGGSTMTGEPGATRAPRPLADEGARGQDVFGLGERERDALLAWVGENLTLVRRSASGQRILYWSLGITFAVGLAAHVGGFLLKSSATTKPLLLVADLLYALGGVLWTGVVLVMFIQIYPEAQSVSTSGPSMPTRRRWALRPEPEAARPRTRRAPGKRWPYTGNWPRRTPTDTAPTSPHRSEFWPIPWICSAAAATDRRPGPRQPPSLAGHQVPNLPTSRPGNSH